MNSEEFTGLVATVAPTIAEALGGRHETEHFVIHYARDSDLADRIEAVGLDHELRHAQLTALLGVAPDVKIRSFLYRDSAQKRALMGADRTFIAKPWKPDGL